MPPRAVSFSADDVRRSSAVPITGTLCRASHTGVITEGVAFHRQRPNSDEALVASRFLSGHAPPDPAAQMGDLERPARSRQVPTNDTPQGSVYAQVRPRPDRLTHLHCLCNTLDEKR
jgi:hypothetical protein